MSARIFLLSPASLRGARARMVLSPRAKMELAHRVRSEEGAPLGDVFAFVSGLYFRGKLAYARRFARPPEGLPGVLVITPSDGLRPPEEAVTASRLRGFARVSVDVSVRRYRAPLSRDARALAERSGSACEVILLGSIATPKYVEPLLEILGERLRFPEAFVGRGDMSRGGLLLRCVREERELEYVPVAGAARHGPRPARLERPVTRRDRPSRSPLSGPHPR